MLFEQAGDNKQSRGSACICEARAGILAPKTVAEPQVLKKQKTTDFSVLCCLSRQVITSKAEEALAFVRRAQVSLLQKRWQSHVFQRNRKTTEISVVLFLEQVMGIEPTNSAWEADVMPLNYTCKRSTYIIQCFLKKASGLPPGKEAGQMFF